MSGRAYGYLRVSTSEQAGSGLGLEAQTAAITAAAGRLGLIVADSFTDAGVSGGLPLEERPALLPALDALRRGDVLIVAKRDRLGRDVLNVAMIERLAERKGARIVSAAGEGTRRSTSIDPRRCSHSRSRARPRSSRHRHRLYAWQGVRTLSGTAG